jgi:zinc/manganese transport system permease protein
VGNILTVSWGEVLMTALWYATLGGILFALRHQFLKVTQDYLAENTLHSKFWDFCFYALFGTVVTSSMKMAGVFLVFSFLIIPSVCALLLAKTMRGRLQVGWGVGALASALGIGASALWDLPTGAAIVAAFGIIFAGILMRSLKNA